MAIRFKCPHCQKPLAVKDHLGGKKAACPVCKKALTIPTPVAAPTAAEAEALAAAAFSEEMAAAPAAPAGEKQTIDFDCPYCVEPVRFPLEDAGKQAQCPECRRIIKVPVPEKTGPKDWRQLLKKGPSAALINQPEQLPDAWGTEVKTKVSGTALEEAGALPEKQAEPVGVGGWIKRVFYGGAVVAVLALIFIALKNSRRDRAEKDAIKFGLSYVEDKQGGLPGRPKSKLPALPTAEIYRCIGELYIGKKEPTNALDAFRKARATVEDPKGSGDAAAKISDVEVDMFLADLCVSLVALGGSDEQVIDKTRLSWNEQVEPEIRKTLHAMRTDDGKTMALRHVASLLIAKNQKEIALGLANSLMSAVAPNSRLATQQVAILFALNNQSQIKMKAPELDTRKPIDPVARQAFAEGYAREGNLSQALELAKYDVGKAAAHRLDTSLGVALLLLSNGQKEKAGDFFNEAMSAFESLGGAAAPWPTLQLIRVGHLMGEDERVKDVGKRLSGAYKNRALLERLIGTLGRSEKAESFDLLNGMEVDKADTTGSTKALAWSALARHNGRRGAGGAIRSHAETLDDVLKPFLVVGAALGEQDAR